MQSSYNCRQCTNTYTRPHDLARHVLKHHSDHREVPPSVSISPTRTPTIREEDLPTDFFKLLEELEETLPRECQSVTTTTTPVPTTSNTPNLAPRDITNYTSTKNICTQTSHTSDIVLMSAKRHKYTNTSQIRTADKATNTDPLIMLDPADIQTLHSGLHIATYNPFHQIYVCTNNSHIKHTKEKSTKLDKKSNTVVQNFDNTQIDLTTDSTPTTLTLPTTPGTTQICDPPKLINNHCDYKTTPMKNSKLNTTYDKHPLKLKKRVQWHSDTITETLQTAMAKTCQKTKATLPKTKPKQKVHTYSKLHTLAKKYYPNELDRIQMSPKHAHLTNSGETDWHSLVEAAYNPELPKMSTDSQPNRVKSTTPTSPVIQDSDFKKDLVNLFGDISSEEELEL